MAEQHRVPYVIELIADDAKLRSQLKKINWEELIGSNGKKFSDALASDAADAGDKIKQALHDTQSVDWTGVLGKIDWNSILGEKQFEALQQKIVKIISANKAAISGFIKTEDTTGIQNAIDLVSALGKEFKEMGGSFNVGQFSRSFGSLMSVLMTVSDKFDQFAKEPEKVSAAFDRMFRGNATKNAEKTINVFAKMDKALKSQGGIEKKRSELLQLYKALDVNSRIPGLEKMSIEQLLNQADELDRKWDEIDKKANYGNYTKEQEKAVARLMAQLVKIDSLLPDNKKIIQQVELSGINYGATPQDYKEDIKKVADEVKQELDELNDKIKTSLGDSLANIISEQISDIKLSVSLGDKEKDKLIGEINKFVKDINETPLEKVALHIDDAANFIEDKTTRGYKDKPGTDDANTDALIAKTENRLDRLAKVFDEKLNGKVDEDTSAVIKGILQRTKEWREQMLKNLKFNGGDFEFKFGDSLIESLQDYLDSAPALKLKIDIEELGNDIRAAVESTGVPISGGTATVDAQSVQQIVTSIVNAVLTGDQIDFTAPISTSTDSDIIDDDFDAVSEGTDQVTESSKKYVTQLSKTSIHIDHLIQTLKEFAQVADKSKGSRAIASYLDKNYQDRHELQNIINSNKITESQKTKFGINSVEEAKSALNSLETEYTGINIDKIKNGADDQSIINMLQEALMVADSNGYARGATLVGDGGTLRNIMKINGMQYDKGDGKKVTATEALASLLEKDIAELLKRSDIDTETLTENDRRNAVMDLLFGQLQNGKRTGGAIQAGQTLRELLDIRSRFKAVKSDNEEQWGEIAHIPSIEDIDKLVNVARKNGYISTIFDKIKKDSSIKDVDGVINYLSENGYADDEIIKQIRDLPAIKDGGKSFSEQLNSIVNLFQENGYATDIFTKLQNARKALGESTDDVAIKEFQTAAHEFYKTSWGIFQKLQQLYGKLDSTIIVNGHVRNVGVNPRTGMPTKNVRGINEDNVTNAWVHNYGTAVGSGFEGSSDRRERNYKKAARQEEQMSRSTSKPSWITEKQKPAPDVLNQPIEVEAFKPQENVSKGVESQLDSLQSSAAEIQDLEGKLKENEKRIQELQAVVASLDKDLSDMTIEGDANINFSKLNELITKIEDTSKFIQSFDDAIKSGSSITFPTSISNLISNNKDYIDVQREMKSIAEATKKSQSLDSEISLIKDAGNRESLISNIDKQMNAVGSVKTLKKFNNNISLDNIPAIDDIENQILSLKEIGVDTSALKSAINKYNKNIAPVLEYLNTQFGSLDYDKLSQDRNKYFKINDYNAYLNQLKSQKSEVDNQIQESKSEVQKKLPLIKSAIESSQTNQQTELDSLVKQINEARSSLYDEADSLIKALNNSNLDDEARKIITGKLEQVLAKIAKINKGIFANAKIQSLLPTDTSMAYDEVDKWVNENTQRNVYKTTLQQSSDRSKDLEQAEQDQKALENKLHKAKVDQSKYDSIKSDYDFLMKYNELLEREKKLLQEINALKKDGLEKNKDAINAKETERQGVQNELEAFLKENSTPERKAYALEKAKEYQLQLATAEAKRRTMNKRTEGLDRDIGSVERYGLVGREGTNWLNRYKRDATFEFKQSDYYKEIYNTKKNELFVQLDEELDKLTESNRKAIEDKKNQIRADVIEKVIGKKNIDLKKIASDAQKEYQKSDAYKKIKQQAEAQLSQDRQNAETTYSQNIKNYIQSLVKKEFPGWETLTDPEQQEELRRLVEDTYSEEIDKFIMEQQTAKKTAYRDAANKMRQTRDAAVSEAGQKAVDAKTEEIAGDKAGEIKRKQDAAIREYENSSEFQNAEASLLQAYKDAQKKLWEALDEEMSQFVKSFKNSFTSKDGIVSFDATEKLYSYFADAREQVDNTIDILSYTDQDLKDENKRKERDRIIANDVDLSKFKDDTTSTEFKKALSDKIRSLNQIGDFLSEAIDSIADQQKPQDLKNFALAALNKRKEILRGADDAKVKEVDDLIAYIESEMSKAMAYGDIDRSDLRNDDLIQEQIGLYEKLAEKQKKLTEVKNELNKMQESGLAADDKEVKAQQKKIKGIEQEIEYQTILANNIDKKIELRKKEIDDAKLTPEERQIKYADKLNAAKERLTELDEHIVQLQADYDSETDADEKIRKQEKLNDAIDRRKEKLADITRLEANYTRATEAAKTAIASEASGGKISSEATTRGGLVGAIVDAVKEGLSGIAGISGDGLATESTLRLIADALTGGHLYDEWINQPHESPKPTGGSGAGNIGTNTGNAAFDSFVTQARTLNAKIANAKEDSNELQQAQKEFIDLLGNWAKSEVSGLKSGMTGKEWKEYLIRNGVLGDINSKVLLTNRSFNAKYGETTSASSATSVSTKAEENNTKAVELTGKALEIDKKAQENAKKITLEGKDLTEQLANAKTVLGNMAKNLGQAGTDEYVEAQYNLNMALKTYANLLGKSGYTRGFFGLVADAGIKKSDYIGYNKLAEYQFASQGGLARSSGKENLKDLLVSDPNKVLEIAKSDPERIKRELFAQIGKYVKDKAWDSETEGINSANKYSVEEVIKTLISAVYPRDRYLEARVSNMPIESVDLLDKRIGNIGATFDNDGIPTFSSNSVLRSIATNGNIADVISAYQTMMKIVDTVFPNNAQQFDFSNINISEIQDYTQNILKDLLDAAWTALRQQAIRDFDLKHEGDSMVSEFNISEYKAYIPTIMSMLGVKGVSEDEFLSKLMPSLTATEIKDKKGKTRLDYKQLDATQSSYVEQAFNYIMSNFKIPGLNAPLDLSQQVVSTQQSKANVFDSIKSYDDLLQLYKRIYTLQEKINSLPEGAIESSDEYKQILQVENDIQDKFGKHAGTLTARLESVPKKSNAVRSITTLNDIARELGIDIPDNVQNVFGDPVLGMNERSLISDTESANRAMAILDPEFKPGAIQEAVKKNVAETPATAEVTPTLKRPGGALPSPSVSKLPQYVYHVTPDESAEKIHKNGLNADSFFTVADQNEEGFKRIIQASPKFMNDMGDAAEGFRLLRIDTTKLGESATYMADQLLQSVPSEAIEDMGALNEVAAQFGVKKQTDTSDIQTKLYNQFVEWITTIAKEAFNITDLPIDKFKLYIENWVSEALPKGITDISQLPLNKNEAKDLIENRLWLKSNDSELERVDLDESNVFKALDFDGLLNLFKEVQNLLYKSDNGTATDDEKVRYDKIWADYTNAFPAGLRPKRSFMRYLSGGDSALDQLTSFIQVAKRLNISIPANFRAIYAYNSEEKSREFLKPFVNPDFDKEAIEDKLHNQTYEWVEEVAKNLFNSKVSSEKFRAYWKNKLFPELTQKGITDFGDYVRGSVDASEIKNIVSQLIEQPIAKPEAETAEEVKQTAETEKQKENKTQTNPSRKDRAQAKAEEILNSIPQYDVNKDTFDAIRQRAIELKSEIDKLYDEGNIDTEEFIQKQTELSQILSKMRRYLSENGMPNLYATQEEKAQKDDKSVKERWKKYLTDNIFSDLDNVPLTNINKSELQDLVKQKLFPKQPRTSNRQLFMSEERAAVNKEMMFTSASALFEFINSKTKGSKDDFKQLINSFSDMPDIKSTFGAIRDNLSLLKSAKGDERTTLITSTARLIADITPQLMSLKRLNNVDKLMGEDIVADEKTSIGIVRGLLEVISNTRKTILSSNAPVSQGQTVVNQSEQTTQPVETTKDLETFKTQAQALKEKIIKAQDGSDELRKAQEEFIALLKNWAQNEASGLKGGMTAKQWEEYLVNNKIFDNIDPKMLLTSNQFKHKYGDKVTTSTAPTLSGSNTPTSGSGNGGGGNNNPMQSPQDIQNEIWDFQSKARDLINKISLDNFGAAKQYQEQLITLLQQWAMNPNSGLKSLPTAEEWKTYLTSGKFKIFDSIDPKVLFTSRQFKNKYKESVVAPSNGGTSTSSGVSGDGDENNPPSGSGGNGGGGNNNQNGGNTPRGGILGALNDLARETTLSGVSSTVSTINTTLSTTNTTLGDVLTKLAEIAKRNAFSGTKNNAMDLLERLIRASKFSEATDQESLAYMNLENGFLTDFYNGNAGTISVDMLNNLRKIYGDIDLNAQVHTHGKTNEEVDNFFSKIDIQQMIADKQNNKLSSMQVLLANNGMTVLDLSEVDATKIESVLQALSAIDFDKNKTSESIMEAISSVIKDTGARYIRQSFDTITPQGFMKMLGIKGIESKYTEAETRDAARLGVAEEDAKEAAKMMQESTGRAIKTTVQRTGVELETLVEKTDTKGNKTWTSEISNKYQKAMEATNKRVTDQNLTDVFGANTKAAQTLDDYTQKYNKLHELVEQFKGASETERTGLQAQIDALLPSFDEAEKKLISLIERKDRFIGDDEVITTFGDKQLKNTRKNLEAVARERYGGNLKPGDDVAFNGYKRGQGSSQLYVDVLKDGIIKQYVLEVDRATGQVKEYAAAENALANAFLNVEKAMKQNKTVMADVAIGDWATNQDAWMRSASSPLLDSYRDAVKKMQEYTVKLWNSGRNPNSTQLDYLMQLSERVIVLGKELQKTSGAFKNFWDANPDKVIGLDFHEDDTLRSAMERYAQTTAAANTSKYDFVSFDNNTLNYQLTDVEGNVRKVSLVWDELYKKIAIVSDKSVSALDPLVTKIEQYKQTIEDAKNNYYLTDTDDAKFMAMLQQISDLEQKVKDGAASFEELETARRNAIGEGTNVTKIAKQNAKLFVGTNEMRSATRQRDKIIGTSDLDFDSNEQTKLVQTYIDKYNKLIAAHQKYVNNHTINDPKIQEALRQQAQGVLKIGRQLSAANTEAEKLENAVNNAGTYTDKKGIEHNLGGSKIISSDELNNMEATMRAYAKSVLGAELENVKFNSVTQKMTGTLRQNNKVVSDIAVQYNTAKEKLYLYQEQERESLSGLPAFMRDVMAKGRGILQYLASITSIYRIWGSIKQGVAYVKEIDAALTELKKVTDETEESYDRFLKTASATASKIGSTIKEVVSSTADWAKLGYSMEQAAQLAETTSVLLNVSEFSSIDDATSALVSTMQAFGYAADDSIQVVDVMNEIKFTCLLIQ